VAKKTKAELMEEYKDVCERIEEIRKQDPQGWDVNNRLAGVTLYPRRDELEAVLFPRAKGPLGF